VPVGYTTVLICFSVGIKSSTYSENMCKAFGLSFATSAIVLPNASKEPEVAPVAVTTSSISGPTMSITYPLPSDFLPD
jgi:hypothetical protein